MRKYAIYISILLIVLLVWFMTKPKSLTLSDKYDAESNRTILTLESKGNIFIPGKWNKIRYDESNGQHYFQSEDSSTIISVIKSLKSSHSFYNSSDSDITFLKKYLEWDKDYWEKNGATVTILDESAHKGYIIWKMYDNSALNIMLLYGVGNDFSYNLAVSSENWTEEKNKEFLKDLYTQNAN